MTLSLRGKKIVVFGGSGFIGSHLVNHLCKEACQIEIISRNNNLKSEFFFGSEPGQVKIKKIQNFDQHNVDLATKSADFIFNLIGILFENKKNSFEFVHSYIPNLIAKSARKKKVRGLVHLSSLNVEKCHNSKYALSKVKGEQNIKSIFPDCIIIKPGVVFGKGDNFTNLFNKMSRFSPFLPIIGSPDINVSASLRGIIDFKKKVKFQPIYVGDLVKYMILATSKKKKVIELAGPSIKTFDQIFSEILKVKKRKRIFLPVPFFLAEVIAFFNELLPTPLITSDQIKLLMVDSISKKGLVNLQEVIKNPTSMESVLSSYL